MDLFNYLIGKKVLPDEMNELQTRIEAALRRQLGFRGFFGITSGASYTVVAGAGFTLSINSGGSENLRGFGRGGHYITVDANPYVTADLSSQFSLPTTPGWSKWLTVFLKQTIVESEPTVEEITFNTENFRKTESFTIEVIEGAEAAAPTKPAIDGDSNPDRIYICDIEVNDTDTDFSTSTIDIDGSRAEVDPLSEVAERADAGGQQFGTETKFALVGDVVGTRFRDIIGSDVNLENALLAALAAGAAAGDRLAILSDFANAFTTIESSAIFGGWTVGAANQGTAVFTIPPGTKYIMVFGHAAIGGGVGGGAAHMSFLIDVGADLLRHVAGGSTDLPISAGQALSILKANTIGSVSINQPVLIGFSLGNSTTYFLQTYVPPTDVLAGLLTILGFTGGIGTTYMGWNTYFIR